jgi:hypothetical protein
MHSRTALFLQAVIAFCIWALLALTFWRPFQALRAEVSSQGTEGIAASTLVFAALLVILEVTLLGFALQRVSQAIHVFIKVRALPPNKRL